MIYLIRHGETSWSATGRHTSTTDLLLTDRGKSQSLHLRKQLKNLRFDQIFTSPLKRALMTCEIAGFLDYAQIDPDLVEWNYGDYEGKTRTEIHQENPLWDLFQDGAPNGESIEQVTKRADRFLYKIENLGQQIAIFSSGHFLRVLIARWLGLPTNYGRYFFLDTASITLLGMEHTRKVILSKS